MPFLITKDPYSSFSRVTVNWLVPSAIYPISYAILSTYEGRYSAGIPASTSLYLIGTSAISVSFSSVRISASTGISSSLALSLSAAARFLAAVYRASLRFAFFKIIVTQQHRNIMTPTYRAMTAPCVKPQSPGLGHST